MVYISAGGEVGMDLYGCEQGTPVLLILSRATHLGSICLHRG